MGVGQEPADDGAFAVIDVTDDDDVHPLLGFWRTDRSVGWFELIERAGQTCLQAMVPPARAKRVPQSSPRPCERQRQGKLRF